jgi:peptidoglycan/LPS O-acetylase OafA/YrhL
VASPLIGLALLIGFDALTADGQGHLSNSVLTLDSPAAFLETVERRLTLAWQQLWRDAMPVITLTCLLAIAFAFRNRTMFEPFDGPIWPAALIGGLVGGLVGSLTEDSGPLLLVVATVTLAGLCAYLLGRPAEAASTVPADPPSR